MCASPDANARRIIGYGFRNPFRFAIDPESDEVYVGNVGWNTYEEIDRFSTIPEPLLQLRLALLRGADPKAFDYRPLELRRLRSALRHAGFDCATRSSPTAITRR